MTISWIKPSSLIYLLATNNNGKLGREARTMAHQRNAKTLKPDKSGMNQEKEVATMSFAT